MKTSRVILQREGPCPCGSGKRFLGCCMQIDGYVQKLLPILTLPGNKTEFSQPGCYLASDQNCSQGLTGEHYISRSVLAVLGEQIKVVGVPWLQKGEERTVGLNSLTANLLCKRHNSALSPLDDEAGKFSHHLDQIHRDLNRHSLSRRKKAHLFSGEAIELWLLKVTCGVCLGFAAKDGVKLKTDHVSDFEKIRFAFYRRVWDVGGGLYLNARLGSTVVGRNRISIAPLTVIGEKRIVGARVWLFGLEFDLLFDMKGIGPPVGGYIHRPSTIEFKGGRRSHFVVLTWPRSTPIQNIQLTASGRA